MWNLKGDKIKLLRSTFVFHDSLSYTAPLFNTLFWFLSNASSPSDLVFHKVCYSVYYRIRNRMKAGKSHEAFSYMTL